MRNGSSCYPAFSLAAALALLIQGATLAATGSIAFEGREWTVDGSIKTSISSAGSFGQDGQSTIGFEAGGFALTDPEGDTLSGTYEDAGGSQAILTPGGESLVAYLDAKLQRAAAESGVALVVNAIEVTKINARAKATSVPTGIQRVLNAQFQTTADVTVDGEAIVVKVTAKDSGKGLLVTPVAGTSWSVPVKIKLSVRRLGKVQDEDTLRLSFGPNAADELGDGEFLIGSAGDDDGEAVRGTFTSDGRQNVELTFPAEVLEALLAEMVEESAAGVATNVSVTLISTVATAKVKHGLSLGLTLNAKFNAEGDVEAERVSTTGGYTVKGTGVPE
jgi:hypothetical protein